MTVKEIKLKLHSKKSIDRKRASKEIRQRGLQELAPELYLAFLEERANPRTWETQSEMTLALGSLGYKQAVGEIKSIVYLNKPHDTLTMFASTAYIQLERKDILDLKPVFNLLDFGSISVVTGALKVIAIDQQIPKADEIRRLIEICWNINKHKDRIGHEYGLIDPRLYIALACSNWDLELTRGFLNHCIETSYNIDRLGESIENKNLKNICQNSLQNKYSKGYL